MKISKFTSSSGVLSNGANIRAVDPLSILLGHFFAALVKRDGLHFEPLHLVGTGVRRGINVAPSKMFFHLARLICQFAKVLE